MLLNTVLNSATARQFRDTIFKILRVRQYRISSILSRSVQNIRLIECYLVPDYQEVVKCKLARPAWTRNCEVVASVCRPQQHHCQPHNNIPANNIQHQPEQQLPTRLGVVASVFTCRSVITSNKEYISFSDMTPYSHGKTKTS